MLMRKNRLTALVAVLALILSGVSAHSNPIAPYIELGSAGPQNWAVLDQGNFSLSDPAGYETGNLGDVHGNVTTGGSAGVTGTVYLGTGANYSGPAPSGGIVSPSSLPGSDLSLANTAAAYYNAQPANFTSAPSAGAVAAGVYKISGDWSPNGGTYSLASGQVYVFDISGNFKPSTASSALFFNDATPWDVIFNVGGNVQSSGGSSTYPMMDGIFLAQGQISLTPGYIDGEIMSDTSINIASRGAVQGSGGPQSVADGGSSGLFLSAAMGLLLNARRKFLL
jgi:hypothetical protein